MARQPRYLPAGHSFHITLRCNSRQFLIAKGLRRDVLLAVLTKAKQKVPHRLYAVCLMANHLHLLIRPDDASELPKLMHWIGWTSAMALNCLSDLCGHYWETKLDKAKGMYRRRWTGELKQDDIRRLFSCTLKTSNLGCHMHLILGLLGSLRVNSH